VEPVAAEPEPGWFNLDRVNKSALRNGAAVGLVFGVAPFVAGVVSLIASGGKDLGALLAVILISAPFGLLGVLCGNAWIQARRRGADWLVVDAQGLRRDVRIRPVSVAWAELTGIEVVATQVIRGDNPYRLYNNPRRRAGEATALRLYPRDPAAFAAAHPPLVTAGQRALPQRLIGAPFGLVFSMDYDERAELVAALRRYAGSLLLGVRDETTAGERRAARISRRR